MATLAIAAIGAGIGASTGIAGATSLGFSVGAILGGILFPTKTTTEGSRLEDLKVYSSTYGKAIPQVYGTMRFAGNVIWSTDIKESRKSQRSGGKGGGATATSYTYSCSFAVGLCKGQITAIRRIWADTKLIYDASAPATNPMEKYPGVITRYLGSETQNPDPTIQAELGAANVPAYRGLAYLVFNNLQLADFGNRIPSIGVEVIVGDAVSVANETRLSVTVLTSDHTYLDNATGKAFTMYSNTLYKHDFVSLSLENSAALPYTSYVNFGVDSQGNFYYGYAIGGVNIHIVKVDGDTLTVSAVSGNIPLSIRGLLRGDKIFVFRTRQVYDLNFNLIVDLSAVFPFSVYYGERPICVDVNGCYWMLRAGVLYKSYDGVNVESFDVSPYVTADADTAAILYDDTTDHVYAFSGTPAGAGSYTILKWSPSNGYVTHLTAAKIDIVYHTLQSANIYPDKGIIYLATRSNAGRNLNGQKINLATMEVVETYTITGMTQPTTYGPCCYERFTHSFVSTNYFGGTASRELVKVPLSRITDGTDALGDVIKTICLQAGLSSSDVDTSGVMETLRGYIISNRCSLRDALSPLLSSYFVDAVETDGVLKFTSRSSNLTPVLTIPYDDLGAKEGEHSEDEIVYIKEDRAQNFDLPERIDLSYADPELYYETNTQHAKRPASVETGTDSAESVSFTMAFTASEAAQLAERLLFNSWLYRTTYSFELPPKYIKLNPADVVTVETPAANLKLRLTEVDYGANNAVACKGVLESADAFVSSATGTSGYAIGSEISVQLPIKAYVLDLPKLVNSDDSDFYTYFCFLSSLDESSLLYYSTDRVSWGLFGAGSKMPSNGKAATKLNDCRSPWVWDNTNTVQVRMLKGDLTSATEDEVLNGANLALLGNEIIQFTTANLVAANTYELSGLLRGRRGTERHTGTHVSGDRFVLLETDSGLFREVLSQTRIGEASYFRSVRSGGNWDDAVEQNFVYNAEAFRCFSPVRIKGTRDGSNNLTITWVRRARWGAEWMSGTDIPLGEATEAYEIDILSGTTVVRTLTATTPTVSYIAAQQTTDFGSPQSSVKVNIYQMNAFVGRGHAGEATV